jgi:hypothetical protein
MWGVLAYTNIRGGLLHVVYISNINKDYYMKLDSGVWMFGILTSFNILGGLWSIFTIELDF